jgi:Uma2 family endonuclease
MALVPSAFTAQQPKLEPVPLLMPWDLRDRRRSNLSGSVRPIPEAVLELAADGHLIAMTPTGGETGARNLRLVHRLLLWADGAADGAWIALESSTGSLLPDRSVLSPDLSLLRMERWQAFTVEQRRRFPPLCPDLVLELASPSDEGPRGVSALRRKMDQYQANGARLGWLLLPEERAVENWREGQ